MTTPFRDRLQDAWSKNDSLLCVGLDPITDRLPRTGAGVTVGLAEFLATIVDATADLVCAFKPQIAHFAAVGAEAVLEDTIRHIRSRAPDAVVILDAKRGDIGSTAEMYAREAFERYDADAVTVNPYLGSDALEPFLRHVDRGTVILCRTSNPGSAEIQCVENEVPMFERVARLASERWNAHGNVMLVAGATHPAELDRIRALAPEIPLLVPGLGAQGGDPDTIVRAGLDADGRGLVVSSSRDILYASSESDFAEAARGRAMASRDALRRAVAGSNGG